MRAAGLQKATWGHLFQQIRILACGKILTPGLSPFSQRTRKRREVPFGMVVFDLVKQLDAKKSDIPRGSLWLKGTLLRNLALQILEKGRG